MPGSSGGRLARTVQQEFGLSGIAGVLSATEANDSEDTRTQLLQMAETWEGLARDREEQIARQERITALEAKGDGDGGGDGGAT